MWWSDELKSKRKARTRKCVEENTEEGSGYEQATRDERSRDLDFSMLQKSSLVKASKQGRTCQG